MAFAPSHICVYFNCSNNIKTMKNISFFNFPIKDVQRTKLWQKNCGNSTIALMDINDLKNKRICEEHFKSEDIRQSGKRKLLFKSAIPISYKKIGK